MNGDFGLLSALDLAGGLALFLYGMGLAVDGLRRATGRRLRAVLTLLTGNPTLGAVAGAAVTVGLQSSSATTVMLVGLADVGVVALRQCVAVIAGAAVGTTLTVQVIAFDIAHYGLVPLVLGLLMQTLARRESRRALGRFLMGFGFIFYGMHMMKLGATPLTQSEAFLEALRFVADRPLLGVLVAAAFTAVVQSSAATLAVAIVIATEAGGAPGLVVPFVLGASIGTCATALLASVSTGRRGKQIAVAHLVIKLIGAAVILPLMAPYGRLVALITGWMTSGGASAAVARQIANANTLFALITGAMVLPFTGTLTRLIQRLLPLSEGGEIVTIGQELKQEWLETPARALEGARREMAYCVRSVREMFDLAGRAVFEEDEEALTRVQRGDARVDLSVEGLTDYLTGLRPESLSPSGARRRAALLRIAREIEFCGDAVSREIVALAGKLLASGADMSIEGAARLRGFWSEVAGGFIPLAEALEAGDASAAETVAARDGQIATALDALHTGYIERLIKGVAAERQTANVYMDLALAARRVHAHLAGAAHRLPAGREAELPPGAGTPDGPEREETSQGS